MLSVFLVNGKKIIGSCTGSKATQLKYRRWQIVLYLREIKFDVKLLRGFKPSSFDDCVNYSFA